MSSAQEDTETEKYLKDFLHSPSDVVTGFDTHRLYCGQDPVHHLPIKNVMDCNRDEVCVGPLFCPKVCGYSMVLALKKLSIILVVIRPQNILHVKETTNLEY